MHEGRIGGAGCTALPRGRGAKSILGMCAEQLATRYLSCVFARTSIDIHLRSSDQLLAQLRKECHFESGRLFYIVRGTSVPFQFRRSRGAHPPVHETFIIPIFCYRTCLPASRNKSLPRALSSLGIPFKKTDSRDESGECIRGGCSRGVRKPWKSKYSHGSIIMNTYDTYGSRSVVQVDESPAPAIIT